MELHILDMIQTIRRPALDTVMVFISSLGNAGLIWIALAIALLLIPRTRKSGWIVSASVLADVVLCNGILKNVFQRTRPFDVNTAVQLLVSPPQDYSFPSGHTALSFAVVTGLFLAGMKKLWKPALVLACLMAFSRMYLYVHYPTDILGGMLVGILAGFFGYRIAMRVMSSADTKPTARNA